MKAEPAEMDRPPLRFRTWSIKHWAILAVACLAGSSRATDVQSSAAWSSDLKDGRYANPVLAGDYSDPDVVRVGDDFYLVSSSFANVPGLPVLHSRDLVNWTLIGHALQRILPEGHYSSPRRGGGVWAPAVRYRDGRFLIYYPDPDHGIYLVSAVNPAGPWSTPVLVDGTKGAIDPAPFWDDDGTAWLVHAFASSRAGRSNVIVLKRLSADGTHVVNPGQTIIDGNTMPPVMTSIGLRPWQTTEGPKLYKRNGWYYVFAPSGSVKGGWQGVFRSRSLAGPYEGRDVMDQGRTAINGPHQGAWISTATGEDWFLHFQDRDSYGRVVHLQPMTWRAGWPVIGSDRDHNGRGEPVSTWRKPRLASQPPASPVEDDEFNGPLSRSWQWNSNPGPDWMLLENGKLSLKSISGSTDFVEIGNALTQKLPALAFTATTQMEPTFRRQGERAGLLALGRNYAWIGVVQEAGGLQLVQESRSSSGSTRPLIRTSGPLLEGNRVWLRLSVTSASVEVPPPDFSPYWPSMLRETHARVQFSYSTDGRTFVELGRPFTATPGVWVGAQLGLFAQAANGTPASTATTVGGARFEWFRLTR